MNGFADIMFRGTNVTYVWEVKAEYSYALVAGAEAQEYVRALHALGQTDARVGFPLSRSVTAYTPYGSVTVKNSPNPGDGGILYSRDHFSPPQPVPVQNPWTAPLPTPTQLGVGGAVLAFLGLVWQWIQRDPTPVP